MLDELRPFLEDLSRGQFRRALTDNRVFRAVVPHGYPSTRASRASSCSTTCFCTFIRCGSVVRACALPTRSVWAGCHSSCFLLLTITACCLMFYYLPRTRSPSDMKDLDTLSTSACSSGTSIATQPTAW